jgi:hypothetical protein
VGREQRASSTVAMSAGSVSAALWSRIAPVQGAWIQQLARTAFFISSFDTLVTLIRYRDRIVDKDDFLREAWRGAVAEESNLTKQIDKEWSFEMLSPNAVTANPARDGTHFGLMLTVMASEGRLV